MVCLRPGHVVTRQVARPGMSQGPGAQHDGATKLEWKQSPESCGPGAGLEGLLREFQVASQVALKSMK